MLKNKYLTTHAQRVKKFMQLAGQEIPDTPTKPGEATRLLRAKLILEECFETIEALGVEMSYHLTLPGNNGTPEDIGVSVEISDMSFDIIAGQEPDLTEIADGCADISVVSVGTLLACGIADKELLEEVDRSNLAKFVIKCSGCEQHWTEDTHKQPDGTKTCVFCEETTSCEYYRADGKLMKPPNWSPPNIARVSKEQECT